MKNSQVISISTFCSNLKKLSLLKNRVSFNPQNPCIFVLLNRFHKNVSGILPAEYVFLPKTESELCKSTQAANTYRLLTANGEKDHIMLRWANILQLTDPGMFSSRYTPRDTLADFLSTEWRSPVNHILLYASWGLTCDIQSIAKLQGMVKWWWNGEKLSFFLWLLSFWRPCVSYWTYDPDICFSFYSVFPFSHYNSSRSNSSIMSMSHLRTSS